jgi:hypothetical protein
LLGGKVFSMNSNDPTKRISPAAIHSLKEALSSVYWYKSDLRSFLTQCLNDPGILGRLNWDDYKRNIVATLIDFLARNEEIYQGQLLRLMAEVSRITDFSHLAKLDDGATKEKNAKAAVQGLKLHIGNLTDLLAEEKEIEMRRQQAHERLMKATAVTHKLAELKKNYFELLMAEPQKRGFQLEGILKSLFELFDLDPKASFRIEGEQIDGAFTFEGTDYLLEAKWQKDLVVASELDTLAGKLSRKLDNTLGLFLSISGYSEDGVKAHSSGRRLMLLMDGSDLMAILEGRIDLIQLLLRKRREASQTGNIYLRIHEILCG